MKISRLSSPISHKNAEASEFDLSKSISRNISLPGEAVKVVDSV